MTMADIYKHRKIGVRIYDNGGRSADRYTAVYTGRYQHLTGGVYHYTAMSEHPFHPQGVGLHGEDHRRIDNRGYGDKGGYSHLGKAITFDDLPLDCRRMVLGDMMDLAVDWTAPRRLRAKQLDQFVLGYKVCALWSSNDESTPEGGEPMDANYDLGDIHQDTAAAMRADCEDFCNANYNDLQAYRQARPYGVDGSSAWECAGHDFWLTRNGHGAGFWDRGMGGLGDRLSNAAKAFGSVDLYVGDDKKIYC